MPRRWGRTSDMDAAHADAGGVAVGRCWHLVLRAALRISSFPNPVGGGTARARSLTGIGQRRVSHDAVSRGGVSLAGGLEKLDDPVGGGGQGLNGVAIVAAVAAAGCLAPLLNDGVMKLQNRVEGNDVTLRYPFEEIRRLAETMTS